MAAIKGQEKTVGSGRKKGVPNKMNADLKNMIHGALQDAGGREYLLLQAHENPSAFLTLVGKIIPKDINQEISGNVGLMANIIINGVKKD
ncbi:MAG: hypothetical protein RL563_1089 [Pseudomonadota bacterium]|jgi:hypothetical protein